MFKPMIKISILSLIVVGAVSIVSLGSGKAYADSCPNSFQDAQNNLNWGVTPQFNGAHGGNMAGMIVHAYDASTPNHNVDVSYRLHSGISGTDPDWGNVNGQQVNLNARIWQDDNGNFSNRTNSYLSKTDSFIGPNAVACKGWDAFGPNDDANNNVGNGYVLDCGPAQPTHFWFTDLSPLPAGDGDNGLNGYWSVNVVDPSSGENFTIDHYTEGSMTFGNHYFTVTNGLNVYVNLIWHPQPVLPPPPPLTTADCRSTTITDEKTGAPGHHSYTQVWITGTNHDQSNFHIGYGDSNTFGYRALSQTVVIHVERYYNNTPGPPYAQYTRFINCYHATCKPSETGIGIRVEGDGPNGIVQTGHSFTVYVPIRNDNLSPDAETIPDPDIGNAYRLSLTESSDDYQGGYAEHDVGTYLNVGNTVIVPITFGPNGNTASVRNLTLNFYPDLWPHGSVSSPNNSGNDDGSCSVTLPIYQHFDASGSGQSSLSPTKENPDTANYDTVVNLNSSVSVCIPTSNLFYKQSSAGARTTLDSNGGSSCPPGYSPGQTKWTGNSPYNIPSGSFTAGDQYCASIHLDYTSGYVGPGGPGDIVGATGPYDYSSCDKVTNEPFFKVYGSGTTAGVKLNPASGQCTPPATGLLAGWNNNSGGQERGAGSQLSALALIKITGFASAQAGISNAGTDAAKLTFANQGTGVAPITTDTDQPDLGGSFSATGFCTDPISPPTNNNPNSQTLPGGSSYGGASGISNDQSVFVNGNVTITGNITYGSGWNESNAPSFVLHATGNIYIDPGVTELDGLFESDQNIYTCANSSGAITSNVYAACNNQLLVHGAFAANQVKLERTFGSLRDEEPTAATPAHSALDGVVWSHAGAILGMACTPISEPQDPDTWNDNYLCVPAGLQLQIGWTFNGGATGAGSGGLSSGFTQGIFDSLNAAGLCTKWTPSGEPSSHGWGDDYTCMSQPGITFSATADPNKTCLKIDEPADPDGQWATGYYLCAPRTGGGGPTATGPPFNSCSNAGVQATKETCAAEVFEFSPELFISSPNANTSNNGPWDAITNLPPVL